MTDTRQEPKWHGLAICHLDWETAGVSERDSFR
jgi:hypothetical protein